MFCDINQVVDNHKVRVQADCMSSMSLVFDISSGTWALKH